MLKSTVDLGILGHRWIILTPWQLARTTRVEQD